MISTIDNESTSRSSVNDLSSWTSIDPRTPAHDRLKRLGEIRADFFGGWH
jgi:hypothetical protein